MVKRHKNHTICRIAIHHSGRRAQLPEERPEIVTDEEARAYASNLPIILVFSFAQYLVFVTDL